MFYLVHVRIKYKLLDLHYKQTLLTLDECNRNILASTRPVGYDTQSIHCLLLSARFFYIAKHNIFSNANFRVNCNKILYKRLAPFRIPKIQAHLSSLNKHKMQVSTKFFYISMLLESDDR
jgi:hypothetical protein